MKTSKRPKMRIPLPKQREKVFKDANRYSRHGKYPEDYADELDNVHWSEEMGMAWHLGFEDPWHEEERIQREYIQNGGVIMSDKRVSDKVKELLCATVDAVQKTMDSGSEKATAWLRAEQHRKLVRDLMIKHPSMEAKTAVKRADEILDATDEPEEKAE